MKKRLLVTVFLVVVLLASALSVVSAAVLPGNLDQNLVAYWSFDTDAPSDATTATDIAGSYDGIVSGATPGVEGRLGIGEAYSFDGSNDHINIGNNLNFPSNQPFSISAWFNMNTYPSGAAYTGFHPVFSKGESDHGQSDAGYSLHLTGTPGIRFRICDKSQTSCISRVGNPSMSLGTWYHLVATYNGGSSSSGINIYLNGVKADTIDDNRGGTFYSLESITNSLYIGKGEFSNGLSYFGGSLDEIGVWTRVLSATEVDELYNSYICIETNDGVEIPDLLDNDCNGIIDEDENGVEYGLWPFGDPSGSIYDGIVDYWDFNTPLSDEATAVGIVNGNDGDVLGDTNQIPSIFDGDGYEVYGDDTIEFTTIASLNGTVSWWQKNCDSDVWHFYVLQPDGTVYVDGNVGALSGDIFVVNGALVVGDGFCGVIDELSIWTRTLTTAEIIWIFEYYFTSNGLAIPVINNGVIDINEECDDGNDISTDCCVDGVIQVGCRCIVNDDGLSECCQDKCTVLLRECVEKGGYTAAATKQCTLADPPVCNTLDADWTVESICDGQGEICEDGYCGGENDPVTLYCADFTDSEACDNAAEDVCARSVNAYLKDKVSYIEDIPDDFCDTGFPLNPSPVNVTELGRCNYFAENCACLWEEGVGCGPIYDQSIVCNLNGEIKEYKGTCKFSTTNKLEECATTGYITYTRTALWNNTLIAPLAGTCDSYTKRYKCVITAELSFFGWFSFMISGIALVGIYAYYIKKRK